MAGLVPAIHVLICSTKGVDARTKSGHDDVVFGSAIPETGYYRTSQRLESSSTLLLRLIQLAAAK